MDDQKNLIVTKQVALFVSTLGAFFTPFMASAINVALPAMAKEFSMNAIMLSWIATSYLLAAAMFLVPVGKIADIYGRKKIFTIGMAVFTASSFLTAISNSTTMLISSRVLQGVGGAMIMGTGMAIIISIFPPHERGKVLGINVASVYTGLSLGPFLGGLMTQQLGWRSIFWINVISGAVIFVVILWKLQGEWAEAQGEKLDLIGSLVYSVMLTALMYGFSKLPALTGAWLILIGVVGIGGFVRWELRIPHPVLDLRLFRHNKALTMSNLAALINYSATSAVAFLLSLYLQYIKGLSPQQAGLVLVAQPIVMAVLSPLAGRLSDRIEPSILASFGMTLTVIGLALLTVLTAESSMTFITAALLILGLGFAFFSSPNTNAVMSSVEKKFYGVVSATLATMRLTGQMLSMGIAMLIFALFIGKVKITPQYFGLFLTSIKTAFAIFAVFCFAGIFASLARGKLR